MVTITSKHIVTITNYYHMSCCDLFVPISAWKSVFVFVAFTIANTQTTCVCVCVYMCIYFIDSAHLTWIWWKIHFHIPNFISLELKMSHKRLKVCTQIQQTDHINSTDQRNWLPPYCTMYSNGTYVITVYIYNEYIMAKMCIAEYICKFV